jgi:hypothetical protein
MRIRIHNTGENDKEAVIIGIGYKMIGKQKQSPVLSGMNKSFYTIAFTSW